MKIKIEKALEILQEAAAVVVESNLIFPSTSDNISDTKDKLFLSVVFTDEEGQEKYFCFNEKDNLEVEVSYDTLFLVDTYNKEVPIFLLKEWEVEKELENK